MGGEGQGGKIGPSPNLSNIFLNSNQDRPLGGIIGPLADNRSLQGKILRLPAEGGAVIETTWHNVTAWEGKGCQDLSSLKKGDWVHVIGRLRCRRYTDAAGIDRTQMDIVANNLERYEKI